MNVPRGGSIVLGIDGRHGAFFFSLLSIIVCLSPGLWKFSRCDYHPVTAHLLQDKFNVAELVEKMKICNVINLTSNFKKKINSILQTLSLSGVN